MNLLRGDFFKKRQKQEAPEKDFSRYLIILKNIAPLSYELLGEDFLKKAIPAYLTEIVINPEDIEETIFYLPLFLRKSFRQKHPELATKEYLIELIDYEFVCYQAINENIQIKEHPYNESATQIYLNPFTHTMRLEFDVHQYAQALGKSFSATRIPQRKKNLLLITKNPKLNHLEFYNAQMVHAAIMDELHDGKILKRDCLTNLQNQLPDIPQRDWIVALQDLKTSHVVLESL